MKDQVAGVVLFDLESIRNERNLGVWQVSEDRQHFDAGDYKGISHRINHTFTCYLSKLYPISSQLLVTG